MAKANTEVIYLANEYLRDILLQELTRRDELKYLANEYLRDILLKKLTRRDELK